MGHQAECVQLGGFSPRSRMRASDCCPHPHRWKLSLRVPVTTSKVPPLLSPNTFSFPIWALGRVKTTQVIPRYPDMEECCDMTFCPGSVSSPGARLSQGLCGQGDSSAHLPGGTGHTRETSSSMLDAFIASVSLESCRGLKRLVIRTGSWKTVMRVNYSSETSGKNESLKLDPFYS